MLIGADPHTDWLPPEIARDPNGFLLTGEELSDGSDWPLERRPYSLETSMPGVFAAGDVRRSSVKRVASAVGEGSIAIRLVQTLLADERLDVVGVSTEVLVAHPVSRGPSAIRHGMAGPCAQRIDAGVHALRELSIGREYRSVNRPTTCLSERVFACLYVSLPCGNGRDREGT